MPLVVPGVVLGTAMYVFQVEVENGLDMDVIGTFYALVAGHVVIVIPWMVRLVTASLRRRRPRHRGSGAESRRQRRGSTFWRITLPAIRPGIVAGALFGFVISFGNLEMSLFLVGPGRTTLPIAILQYLEWKIDPDHRRGVGGADPADRHRDADHRPLRQAGAGGLTWRDLDSTACPSTTATSTPCARSRSRSPTASSWCCWARPAAARPRRLRMIAGFIEPTAGHVRLGGQDVTLLPPWKRNAGMVFQSYALFPHLTVAQNVAFGLEMRKLPRADIDAPRRGGAGAWCGSAAWRPPAAPALGRPAAARGAGPRARHPARRAAARRAAVQPRRQAAPGGAGRDPRAAAPARPHHRDGHPRPGRGADHGRPAGGDERGLGAPGRHASATSTSVRPTASSRASSAARNFLRRHGRGARPLPHRRRPRARLRRRQPGPRRAVAAAGAGRNRPAAAVRDSTTACPARWNSCRISAP